MSCREVKEGRHLVRASTLAALTRAEWQLHLERMTPQPIEVHAAIQNAEPHRLVEGSGGPVGLVAVQDASFCSGAVSVAYRPGQQCSPHALTSVRLRDSKLVHQEQ
eukprot:CAMPEP_0181233298 /NCGR_PEP_ID=MMETSP1096-20121128/36255_1 /TAXON_ID=156174 ORGANISM="Chrysochromulina ericina, Strain CCMP281" /NCGR_SAMPLE_ID=MMETSP1096 /ASSEMBLY_ACC=CAM_ASM_000453 /LENGTH=105 /DNA_ID=CAMNT_0023327777 /DNA_START=153 /DNA_END=470 /DNA_ORIENTATION=-